MQNPKQLPDRTWSAPRASPTLVVRARELRKEATPAEKLLWQYLRNKQIGNHKFRRQHPIGGYIADFYCPVSKVVVELDGAVHEPAEQRDKDEVRTRMIGLSGVRVLRFRNEEIFENLRKVLRQIEQICVSREEPSL